MKRHPIQDRSFSDRPEWLMEEEEKEEQPKSDLGMFSKKLERYFFEKRSVTSGAW